MAPVHFESVTRSILYGRTSGHDEVSVRAAALCGGADRGDALSPARHEVTCVTCLNLLMAVKRENVTGAVTNIRWLTRAQHRAAHGINSIKRFVHAARGRRAWEEAKAEMLAQAPPKSTGAT